MSRLAPGSLPQGALEEARAPLTGTVQRTGLQLGRVGAGAVCRWLQGLREVWDKRLAGPAPGVTGSLWILDGPVWIDGAFLCMNGVGGVLLVSKGESGGSLPGIRVHVGSLSPGA